MSVVKIKTEVFGSCQRKQHDICAAVMTAEAGGIRTDAKVCACPCHVRQEWEQ